MDGQKLWTQKHFPYSINCDYLTVPEKETAEVSTVGCFAFYNGRLRSRPIFSFRVSDPTISPYLSKKKKKT